jgi:hypothetical protein
VRAIALKCIGDLGGDERARLSRARRYAELRGAPITPAIPRIDRESL